MFLFLFYLVGWGSWDEGVFYLALACDVTFKSASKLVNVEENIVNTHGKQILVS